MRSYWRLSEDERDQIGVLRAAGRSMGVARALGRAKPPSPGSCSGTHSLWADKRVALRSGIRGSAKLRSDLRRVRQNPHPLPARRMRRLHKERRICVDPKAERLSYDFSRREGEKEPLGEGGCPLVSGEGRIGSTLTV